MIQIPAHFISQYIKFIAERGVQPVGQQYCEKLLPLSRSCKKRNSLISKGRRSITPISLYCDMLPSAGR